MVVPALIKSLPRPIVPVLPVARGAIALVRAMDMGRPVVAVAAQSNLTNFTSA